MSFAKGDRVVLKDASNLETHNEYERDVTAGTVQSPEDHDNYILVKWDGSWRKPNPEKVEVKRLISEEEANKILDKLEAEFEAWAAPIREKMKQAAALLNEASNLAGKQKRDIAEMHEITAPLIRAMDNLGWRTSSLSC